MSKKHGGAIKRDTSFFDLLNEGDELLDVRRTSMRGRQTVTPSASTLPDLFKKVRKSGWDKPTIQLSALLGMELDGLLTLGGARRLSRLMTSQSVEVISAALTRRDRIASDPSFEMLRAWCNRPCSVRPAFHRIEKRRIGVGYRDKGSLPPSHSRGRQMPGEFDLYLGERKEWLGSYSQQLYTWIQDYGYLLIHQGDGWWAPDTRLRQHLLKSGLYPK